MVRRASCLAACLRRQCAHETGTCFLMRVLARLLRRDRLQYAAACLWHDAEGSRGGAWLATAVLRRPAGVDSLPCRRPGGHSRLLSDQGNLRAAIPRWPT